MTRVRRWVAFPLFITALCLMSQFAMGQSVYGSIQGTLTDAAGSPIAGAKVTLSSIGKGVRFTTETDDSGSYLLTIVPPDDYRLRIEAAGFKTFENPFVTIYADLTTTARPRLVKGSAAEVVSGSAADVSVLKIDRTDVSTILSLSQITDLPLLQQNVSSLQVLVPGAIPQTSSLPVVQNPQQGPFININGQDFAGDAYQLDGTDNRDALEGIVVINPNQDAIQEMKITTQNYSAEFGEATAGVVTAQTKSGSNQLHGTVFGYRQTGWGQASYPNFNTGVTTAEINAETLKRDQFGGSLGGPLIKNKLFFFADYRGERDSSGATLTLTVPTTTVRNTCTGVAGTGVNGVDCDLHEYGIPLANGSGSPYTIVDTTNVCSFGPCYLLNSAISPQMVYLMDLLPMPTAGGITNNFSKSGAEELNSDNSDLRLDYDTQKWKLFARYTYDSFRQTGTPAFMAMAGGPGLNPDLFAGRAATPNQGASAGFSYTFSPQLSTDFRFGYLRFHLDLNAPDFGANTLLAAGIQGLTSTGDIYSSDLANFQIQNSANVGGSTSPPSTSDFLDLGYAEGLNSCNCPLREHEQQFQWVDNWTLLAGHHAFRFGGDFRYIENFRLQSAFPGIGSTRSGSLQFGNSFTGIDLGDFLAGTMAFFDRTYADPSVSASLNAQERQKRLFFYGQDTWRVTPRLTLNYGLRWEAYFPQTVNQANAGGFLLVHNNSLTSLANTSINVAGENGVGLNGNVENTYKNFGPRFGFAYLAGAKTVIRGGYGRSFDVGYAGSLFGIAATQNPPVEGMITENAGSGGVAGNPPAVCSPNGNSPCPPFIINGNLLNPASPLSVVDLSNYSTSNFSAFEANPTLLTLCSGFILNQLTGGSNICNLGFGSPNGNAPEEGVTLFALPSKIRVPTVDAWNLTIQHELAPSTFVELAYIGNKGTHVLTDTNPYYNLNFTSQQVVVPPADTIENNGTPVGCAESTGTGNAYYKPISHQGTKTIDSSYCVKTVYANALLAPWVYPILYFGNSSSNNYNSLQARFSRSFKGLSLLAHYTYSKILDYDSAYFAENPGASYGPGNYDRRHSVAVAGAWILPIGRNKLIGGNMGRAADRVLGGWELSTITTWYSGLPFTPSYSECEADLRSEVAVETPCRPNLVGPVSISGNRSQYFTTTNGNSLTTPTDGTTTKPEICGLDLTTGQPEAGAAIGPWQRPGCGQLGTASRNSLRGPQWFDSDFSLIKEIPINDRVAMRLRVDAFNLFNKVNLGLPNPVVDSSQGGTITGVAPGAVQRQFQFSAKVMF